MVSFETPECLTSSRIFKNSPISYLFFIEYYYMLYIKVKKILRSKEIDIDKYTIIIIEWQRCGVRRMSVTFFIDFQERGRSPEIYRLADFTSRA
jgi:hypothetical protein